MTMDSRVALVLERHKSMDSARGQHWLQHWQELADVMLPRRADFVARTTPGERRTENVYDGTPMLARRALASAIDGLLKPKTARWFRIRVQDDAVNEDDEARRWFEDAEKRMWAAIYARKAHFVQRSGEVDNDLVTFGTGVLFIGERRDLGGLMFKSIHLRDALVDENADGEIDTLYQTIWCTPRQAKQKWGEENLSTRVKEALKTPAEKDKLFRFVQAVFPREDRDTEKSDSRNLPFASLIVDADGEHLVGESGFHEFPFAVPRWETAAGEVYGRSPGMIALPDAKTLQAMGKTLLVGSQKAVDPPMWAMDDAVIGAARTMPGGMTYLDGSGWSGSGAPMGVLDMGKNIPLGREMQNDTREQVWQAFFRNVLNLPTDGPQMTATEVLERKEEFIRTIGPVFGQLESDYIGQIVERCFGIMVRAGAFAEAPEILAEREPKFEFESPVARARRQSEIGGFARAMEVLTPLITVQADMLDRFDTDQIAEDVPEALGASLKWLRTDAQVDAIRQERKAKEMAAMALEAGESVARMAKDAAAAGPPPGMMAPEGQAA